MFTLSLKASQPLPNRQKFDVFPSLRKLSVAVTVLLTASLLQTALASPLPISSPFGWRSDPLNGQAKFHAGVDFPAATGTPVRAAQAGYVVFSGQYGGYGEAVVLDHGNSLFTLYGHNSQRLVTAGQAVQPGQPIALVGATGRVTGPHLHFEVHYRQQYLNPVDYIGTYFLPPLDSPLGNTTIAVAQPNSKNGLKPFPAIAPSLPSPSQPRQARKEPVSDQATDDDEGFLGGALRRFLHRHKQTPSPRPAIAASQASIPPVTAKPPVSYGDRSRQQFSPAVETDYPASPRGNTPSDFPHPGFSRSDYSSSGFPVDRPTPGYTAPTGGNGPPVPSPRRNSSVSSHARPANTIPVSWDNRGGPSSVIRWEDSNPQPVAPGHHRVQMVTGNQMQTVEF